MEGRNHSGCQREARISVAKTKPSDSAGSMSRSRERGAKRQAREDRRLATMLAEDHERSEMVRSEH